MTVSMEKHTAAVITVSDKGSTGEREDTGGPLVKQILEDAGLDVVYTAIIPDEQDQIEQRLRECSDEKNIGLIMTTGGTGFAKRDVTPEATRNVCQKLVSGIPEAMRTESLKITKRAMLSRMEAGIREKSLIVNLPGSPKAIKENLEAVIDALDHGLEMLRGKPRDCATDSKEV